MEHEPKPQSNLRLCPEVRVQHVFVFAALTPCLLGNCKQVGSAKSCRTHAEARCHEMRNVGSVASVRHAVCLAALVFDV